MGKNMTTPDEILQTHIQTQRREIDESMKSVFEAIIPQNSKLPEDVFKTHFVPFFKGELEHEANANRNVIAEWVSVAGSPMAQVDIIDNDGKTMFTVPPIFDTAGFDVSSHKAGNSIKDIMTEYFQRKGSVPQAATAWLNATLIKKSDDIAKNTEGTSLELSQRWRDVLIRYGYEDGKPTKAQAASDDNDVVYD